MRAGYGEVVRQVGRLLGGGSVAALGEDRLLERFAAEGDGAAFEALVARHGPMVLGTCRRMLGDGHDVEDAFQATFLVLARRAGTIRDADRLGPWLHGVARRVARRARAQSARRRSVEGPGGEDRAIAATDGSVEAAELRAALDEELGRLPEKYRAPLVLCYLEGLTHDEAAGRLRWPVGTVRSRLAGGRDRLRGRLARRGLSPTAAPAALPILHIPTPLMTTTVRLATMAGTPSAHVAALAKGAMIAMMISKLKLIAAFGVLGGLAAGGAGAMTYRSGDGPAKAEAAPAVMPDPARRLAAVREERSKLEEDDETLTSKVKKLEAETQLQIQKIQADGASRREQFLKEIGESRAKQRQLNEEAKALLLQLPPAPPALEPEKGVRRRQRTDRQARSRAGQAEGRHPQRGDERRPAARCDDGDRHRRREAGRGPPRGHERPGSGRGRDGRGDGERGHGGRLRRRGRRDDGVRRPADDPGDEPQRRHAERAGDPPHDGPGDDPQHGDERPGDVPGPRRGDPGPAHLRGPRRGAADQRAGDQAGRRLRGPGGALVSAGPPRAGQGPGHPPRRRRTPSPTRGASSSIPSASRPRSGPSWSSRGKLPAPACSPAEARRSSPMAIKSTSTTPRPASGPTSTPRARSDRGRGR